MFSSTKRRLEAGGGEISSRIGARSPSRPAPSSGSSPVPSPAPGASPMTITTTTTTTTTAATTTANNNNNSDAVRRSPSASPTPPSSFSSLAPPASGSDPTPSLSTLQPALRDRDARIADLERKLAAIESGPRASHDPESRADSEEAVFWRGRCAALEDQVKALQKRLAAHGKDGGGPAGARKAEQGRADGDSGDDKGNGRAERRILEKKNDEIAQLKAQVKGLKEFVSVSTRTDGEVQISDEVFGERMARLGNGLQNWVLVNFRRAKVDLASLDESTHSALARLVPMYQELASTSRIHLLQSLVSRLLVGLVFDPYFIGLPPHVADPIQQVDAFLASASSLESANRWRSLTLSIFRKDAAETLRAETAAVVDAAAARIIGLLDSITHATATDARDQALRVLLADAVDLAQLLAVQRAVFRVDLPPDSSSFNEGTMEDVGGEESEEDEDAGGGGGGGGRIVWCVTFPALIKHGDESGAFPDEYRNVIAKAKVLCRSKI
ncbi:hypothetical protein VTJ83DRAFT_6795 [Remersonia thermophila]|uniref:Uncharacterized protein n=1 Tax=Remersonia thermophila TaxID=72144 RepID=A0ABR4D6J7_9PEZI